MRKNKRHASSYDLYATLYNTFEFPLEQLWFKHWRKAVLAEAKGKVLEIGIGTGKNLRYYPPNVQTIVGIDIREKMLEQAQQEAKVGGKNVTLLVMDAEKLSFPDKSFDTVVGTFVLCSVKHPKKVLKEIKRVTKKGGKILLLEHVLSKHPLLAMLEYLHNPFTKALFGVEVIRDTKSNILASGLTISKEKNLGFYDIFKAFYCTRREI